jgi:hypothetical protein
LWIQVGAAGKTPLPHYDLSGESQAGGKPAFSAIGLRRKLVKMHRCQSVLHLNPLLRPLEEKREPGSERRTRLSQEEESSFTFQRYYILQKKYVNSSSANSEPKLLENTYKLRRHSKNADILFTIFLRRPSFLPFAEEVD